MKIRSFFQLLPLAFPALVLGQDSELLMRQGDQALAAGLWEMAALHYGEVLASAAPDSPEKSQAAVRLAETLIREGKPAEAFELLNQPFTASHAEAPFWKNIALAELGRVEDASSGIVLLLEKPDSPHRTEAAFTLANLSLALDSPERALAALSTLQESEDPELIAGAKLHQVEILIDLDRIAEARATMPEATTIAPADRPLATFLEAHLLLKEDKPTEAAAIFQSLINQPQGQSSERYHGAAVALADSLLEGGNTEEATTFLLTFIQDHPDSPSLEALFDRLLRILPATPARTDPILERLAEWITPAEVPPSGLLGRGESLASAPLWSGTSNTSELLAHALHAGFMGLRRVGTPESTLEAKRLLTRLRISFPEHPLTHRALFEFARATLAGGSIDEAFGILDSLRATAGLGELAGRSAFLQAEAAHTRGDHSKAMALFDEAAKSLAGDASKAARLNAAVIRLASGTPKSKTVGQEGLPEDKAITADLKVEQALSETDPAAKRTAIEAFLTDHPEHPRVAEARLAAAECAITGAIPDLSFARAQLDTLAADPENTAKLNPVRIALIRLRIEDLAGDSAAAITTARALLDQHPEDPAAGEVALILGRNLFQASNYNDARLVLEKLAAAESDPGRAQAAWLLAARSAALVPTSQSQSEALVLFDKVIDADGSLSPIARLEKGRLMIDMNRLEEASEFLRKWFESLPASDPLHIPTGLLLGEAIYAQGSQRPDSLNEALAVYDKLLEQVKKHPSLFNRLQYLRGRTLEQIPDASDPSLKRERQAFIAYYSVLETTTPPLEWHYFELCGFRALALLEKSGRWPAAIACAKRIASFNGPRATEAAERAAQLQLKHMIWED